MYIDFLIVRTKWQTKKSLQRDCLFWFTVGQDIVPLVAEAWGTHHIVSSQEAEK